MADLSPQAQQIFWEFNRAASGKPDDWHYMPAIAAALRAAAEQGKLGPDHWQGSHPDERELGWNAAMTWLEDVAAELKGKDND